jgi:phosphoenolpyruvate---glycerone phosphotransferase subunit DhaL
MEEADRSNHRQEAYQVLEAVGVMLRAHTDELCALDAAMGDGDHGVSMMIGYRAVHESLIEHPVEGVAAMLRAAAAALMSSVGAAMGPLFSTASDRAGRVLAEHPMVDATVVALMLEAARDGVIARGKCAVGDKTMLDALAPAAEAARAAAEAGLSAEQSLAAAAEAAVRGAEATKAMIARRGRASRLGERTLGCQDPGATSVALILQTISRALLPGADSADASIPAATEV